MRGLRLNQESGPFLDTQCPRPQRQPGEALIRITRVGICNTDLEMIKGYYPFSGSGPVSCKVSQTLRTV